MSHNKVTLIEKKKKFKTKVKYIKIKNKMYSAGSNIKQTRHLEILIGLRRRTEFFYRKHRKNITNIPNNVLLVFTLK